MCVTSSSCVRPYRSLIEKLQALFRDASLGQAANNPTVKVSFPTGDSNADKRARLTAGTIALQNLNGPGQGCPNVSTTFAAQGAALN